MVHILDILVVILMLIFLLYCYLRIGKLIEKNDHGSTQDGFGKHL